MKKIHSAILLTILLSMFCPKAFAHDIAVANADGVTIYYNWTNNNTELSVSYRGGSSGSYSDRYTGNVVIPASVTYNGNTYPVTRIGNEAFNGCSDLTNVTIPNSVTSIGDLAFQGCSKLKSVTIGNSVTRIGKFAFADCSKLTSVTIPNSVTTIGSNVFENCSKLTSVTIGNSVTFIAGGAFSGCTSLTSVTIPNSVTVIGVNAFQSCSKLTSVTIPNSVTNIREGAFEYCRSLTSVTIPNSVTNIGEGAFSGCSSLTSVTIPNSVTNIGEGAFSGCSSLTSVTFHCQEIKSWFNGLTSIKEIIIGDEVTIISDYAFSGWSSLTSVTIPNSVTSIGMGAFEGCSGLTSVAIGNSVTSIGNFAFSGCSSLTSVTIPNSVTSIENNTFAWCSGLTSVTIPNSVTAIDYNAFANCSKLTSVTIGNSVTSIGSSAFYNCSGLTSVTIPSSVTEIGSGAFPRLKKTIWLTNTLPSGYNNAQGDINYVSNYYFGYLNGIVYPFLSSMFEVDGIKYVPVSPSERTCDAIDCVYNETAATTKIGAKVSYQGIEMSVKNLQPYVCYNNIFINKLEMSYEGSVPRYAFGGCSNMMSVILGDANIENFEGCYIGSSISAVEDYAFLNCDKIKNLIIADREEELKLGSNGNNSLFSSCPLDSVYIGGNLSYNTSNGLGYSPFYSNTSLRSVHISDKETEISDNEFYGCTNLQNVRIGDGVETIGNWAFSGCSSLKYFVFGTKVKTIGWEAFSDCTAMSYLISKVSTPPVCGAQSLDDINKWQCKLFVPQGSMANYQTANQWKDFFFIEEGDYGDYTPTNPEKCAQPTITYAHGKLTFSCETEGATCMSTIRDNDIMSYDTNEVQLGVTYHISVYATKEGYEDSDVATATLCWIDVEPKTEGIENGIASIPAHAVLIQSNGGILDIQGIDEGTPISVFNTAGQLVGAAKASEGNTSISTTLRKGEVGIVKIGEKAIKVVMK